MLSAEKLAAYNLKSVRNHGEGITVTAEHGYSIFLPNDVLAAICAHREPTAPINLEGLTNRLLAPREVVRDADGWLIHPALPICDEGVRYDTFLAAFGIETYFCPMDGDAPADVVERYFDQENANCSSWNPTPPEGDGWVLLEIFDTEDGPLAVFARRELKSKGNQ